MLRITSLILCLAFIVGCGVTVEVPPAHVGKLSTASGLKEGIIPPSKLRLSNMCLTCDSLVIAEASDYAQKESMQVFMPKDKLNITVEVRGTFAISNDQVNMDRIFDRVTADPTEETDRVTIIPLSKVYETYAQPMIREAVRGTITKYDIMQVMENRDAISEELFGVVRERLKGLPITATQFGLADVQPPRVIVAAQEAAKERAIAIDRAEADKQVKLKEAEAALEIAKKQQQVDLKEAETQVLVNQKLAEGVNQAFIAQRALRVLEAMANSDNKIFFMPTEAMHNPAIIMGTVNDGFSTTRVADAKPAKSQ